MEQIITREFKDISERASELLKREEGLDVEFKQSIDALDITDIVAFANSPTGGAILVGISEIHEEDGRQTTKIHGVRVGDRSKMNIVSKVNSIVPQLHIKIYVENRAHKPFYRLEIPSGPNKPYCSTSGIYKIRDDGYSKPLMPNTMLAMLLEKESERFYQRFHNATAELEDDILSMRQRAKTEVDQLERQIKSLGKKMDVLLEDLGIDDPVKAERQKTIARIKEQLKKAGINDDHAIFTVIKNLESDKQEK